MKKKPSEKQQNLLSLQTLILLKICGSRITKRDKNLNFKLQSNSSIARRSKAKRTNIAVYIRANFFHPYR
jgi:hypothetical protein